MKRRIFILVLVACAAAIGLAAPQTTSVPDEYIINGRDAKEGEFPYQVSIQEGILYNNITYHICGGSIIDERHILTAGHCIYNESIEMFLIVAGTTNLSVPTDPNRVNLTIEQYYVHEDYDGFYYLNDIALIRVNSSFPLNSSYVQSIPLRTEQLETPEECTVTGWGTTSVSSDEHPDVLQTVEVPLVDYDTCKKIYDNYTLQNIGQYIVMPGMLCAGYLAGGKVACQGDFGGPLVCDNQLTGIVSWGIGCALPKYPGVYTDVAYYKDWIERHLARSYEDAGLLERHL